MITELEKKIQRAKLNIKPFPHIVIKNFLSLTTLKRLNVVLPNYDDVNKDQVIFQSSSETKKIIMQDSKVFKNLLKKNIFKQVNNNLKKIKPTILKKFKNEISKNVNTQFVNSKIEYNMNFALMKKGYLKSPHLDRRDHLISGVYYPASETNKGGNLEMYKTKKKTQIFDVFPSKKNLKIGKNYKINKNFCVFFLNVPWAYHSVTKYYGETDRKYFYIDYDFKGKKSSSSTKSRKKGLNESFFWKNSAKVKSTSRKKLFLTE